MLSDDVSGAVSTTVSKTGAVVGGTVRGGLLGAALTLAGGAVGLGTASAIGAAHVIGATAASVAGAGVIGTVTGATFMLTGALPLVIAGAAIGAALLGLGSLIPGVSDMWHGAKKIARGSDRPAPAPVQQDIEIVQSAPAPRVKRTIVYDNPNYVEGRGAQMMEKGDCAPTTTVCR